MKRAQLNLVLLAVALGLERCAGPQEAPPGPGENGQP